MPKNGKNKYNNNRSLKKWGTELRGLIAEIKNKCSVICISPFVIVVVSQK